MATNTSETDVTKTTTDETGETAKTATDETGETAKTATDETGETAKTTTDETGETAKTTTDETGETAKTTTDETGETAKTATNETSETAKTTTDETSETVETPKWTRICIVAMDGSEHADYALEWYLENAHREGDHVVIVYVPELHDILHSSKWTVPVYQFDKEVAAAMVRDEHIRIRAELTKFACKLKEHKLGGKVESVIASKAGEGIVQAAERENADLVILGSRGQNTLRRTFMGSISDYVVHHSHVPVLVCKHPKWHSPGPHHYHPPATDDATH